MHVIENNYIEYVLNFFKEWEGFAHGKAFVAKHKTRTPPAIYARALLWLVGACAD